MRQRFVLMFWICLICVGADQITKIQATAHLAGQPPLIFWGGAFRLQYALNPGAWGSMGSNLPEALRAGVFTWGVGLILLALVVYTVRQEDTKGVTAALSLILAGGLGNLIDRALYGHVVDFLYLGLPGVPWLQTNIFNIADVAIMAGVGMMLVFAFKAPAKPVEPEVAAVPDTSDSPDEGLTER
jgi:signal peptidase II